MGQFCPKCRDFHGPNPGCEKFEVCFPETDPEGWREIWAWDEGEAVEKMSERIDCNSAEYEIAKNGGCGLVHVRKADDENAEIHAYRVTAEQTIIYSANQITPKGPQ